MEDEREVPEGAAVFPEIPPELGVNPLLLAVLHATVFLSGSEEDIVDSGAADEAVEYMAGYLRRLAGDQLRALHEDLECLAAYARGQQWPKVVVHFLKSFAKDFGLAASGPEKTGPGDEE